MARDEQDRGMRAVARVRGVRERDSRLGLARARAEEEQRAARLQELHGHVEGAPVFDAGTAASFLAIRESLLGLGAAVAEAREELGSATRLTEAARGHWQADRSRLAAVEQLLERRAGERRREAARAESGRLDEAATVVWRRGHEEQS